MVWELDLCPFFSLGKRLKSEAGGTVPGKFELKGSENRRVRNYEGYRRLPEKMGKGVTRREFDFMRLRMSKKYEHQEIN